MKHFIRLLFLSLGVCNTIAAQTFDVYTTGNSPLPTNTVKSIAIDSAGNKWFGTNVGLVYYDDLNWTIYNTTNCGLPDNNILTINIDSQGNKWIGTISGGLAKFDGTGWTVYNTTNSGIPDNYVRALAFDENEVWIGTTNGLVKFTGSEWTHYYNISDTSHQGNIMPTNNINSLAMMFDGTLCVGTLNGGLIYITDTTFVVYNHDNNPNIPDNTFTDIALDASGNRWLGTPDGGMIVHYGANTWSWYSPLNSNCPSTSISAIDIAPGGEVLFGSQDKGFGIFSGDADWQYFDTLNSTFPQSFVLDVVLDHNNIAWIGTLSEGLVRFDFGNYVSLAENDFDKVSVYPNPADRQVIIESTVHGPQSTVTIIDISGKEICHAVINGKTILDISGFEAGIYFLRIAGEENSTTRKLVIY